MKKIDADITKAVNWIKFDENRKLIGNNFDGKGFVNGFLEQKHSLANKSICLFGTGGAGVAIAYALANENLKKLTFINRDINKANYLKSNINKIYPNLHIQILSNFDYELHDFDIVINATSLGLKNNDKLGLGIFTDKLEKFIPSKKGKKQLLRIIRELIDYTPKSKKTNIMESLSTLNNKIKRKKIGMNILCFRTLNK